MTLDFEFHARKSAHGTLSRGPVPHRCLRNMQGMTWAGNCSVPETKWEKVVITCFGKVDVCDFSFPFKDYGW